MIFKIYKLIYSKYIFYANPFKGDGSMSLLDTTILIGRHGLTYLNESEHRKLPGGDGPISQLSEQGTAQAHTLGKLLAEKQYKIDAFYSSGLTRASKTAEIVQSYFHGTSNIIKKPEFSELRHDSHSGVLTDLWDAYAKEYFAVQKKKANGLPERDYKWKTTPFQGEETISELFDRLTKGIVQITNEHPGKTIFVCTHGASVKTLILGYTTPPNEELPHYIEAKNILNCAISVFKCTPGAGKSSIKYEGQLDLEKSQ